MNGYVHKADRSAVPVCRIMGVDVAAVDMKYTLDFTRENIDKLRGDYMCVSNVHTTVTAWENKSYCDIQNGGIMAIPDGAPLSRVGRRRGFAEMKRVTGPAYFEEILKISAENKYRHFLYGSTDETLKKLSENIAEKFPDAVIAGMYSPPFRQLTPDEDNAVISMINSSKPDFVWVALGAPKQEIWMSCHQGKINGFMVGVGAAFDYMAGNIKRAPLWMQKCDLEWLYRLMQDPARLFKRYLHTNLSFIWNAVIMGK